MQQQDTHTPLDYAVPTQRVPRRPLSPAKKWMLIIMGLCLGAGLLCVVLWYAYVVSLGPMWP